jgi:hypothetical protein
MRSEAKRRAFVAEPRLELVEIFDQAVSDGREIDNDQLQNDIQAELKRYRAEHPRKGKRKSVSA